MFKIVVVGELCEDILMHNPSSVEVIGRKVWAEDITVTAGGSASYVATALVHLGANVKISSVVGKDEAGDRIIEMMVEKGVDCSLIKRLEGHKTTRSMMVCNREEKIFIGCSPMLPMQLASYEELKDADLIFIAGYMLFPELWTDDSFLLFRRLKDHGVMIALDGQMLPIEKFDPIITGKMDRILPLVDVFFAARKEIAQITGDTDSQHAGQMLLDIGCKTIVLKQGADGCIVMSKGQKDQISSYKVDAYDTVGSGDIFGASFCYAMLGGMSSNHCSKFASVFTGLSLGRYDDYKKYPSQDLLEEILSNISEEKIR